VTHRPTYKWADLPDGRLTRENAPRSWTALFDLASEAYKTWSVAGHSPLTLQEWRALVDGVANGLPVVLETRRPLLGEFVKTETTIRTYVVDDLTIGFGTTSNMRLRTWGFGYPEQIGHLQHVNVPRAVYDHDAYENMARDSDV